jgi:two-component system, NtrC family, sensor histidine kinase HydH
MLPLMTRARRTSTRLAGWSVVVAFVLIGVALVITVWTTRSSVEEASVALRGGQAMAVAHAVRADLTAFDEPPTAEELAEILDAHREEGLRYVGLSSAGRLLTEAGAAEGTSPDKPQDLLIESVGPTVRFKQRGAAPPGGARGPLVLREILRETAPARTAMLPSGRVRIVVPVGLFGGMHPLPGQPGQPGQPGHPGPHPRRGPLWHAVIEVEPVQANALREAARLSWGIGALAAASLLAVAIVLVRREARRHADERERERQRRLASLGEMSAVLAHEIRNPLASLKGNAQLLAQMLPAGEKPRAKAERVVDEAARLEKLTADLLAFVRTGALQRAAADPVALVREAAATTKRAPGPGAPSEDVLLDVKDAPASWSVDADRLREVLVNLLDNARAAGPPVTVTVRTAGGRLRLDVADRGPGVPEGDRERIFEPFVTGKTQGTGLGLAVARRVIEAHGGALEVLDAPGGGALFRIELPESQGAH